MNNISIMELDETIMLTRSILASKKDALTLNELQSKFFQIF